MSNIIQIKRGHSIPDKKLAPYELGVQISDDDDDNNKLFIGGALNEDGSYGDAKQIKVENAVNAEKLGNIAATEYVQKANIIGEDASLTVWSATNANKLGGKEASVYVQRSEIIGDTASEQVQNSVKAENATNATNAANAANANKLENESLIEILKKIYPVGSIYTSTTNTNPSTLLGFGEWTQIKDRFLLAAGDEYLVNSIGGEATHTLTTSEMPSHSHQIIRPQWYSDNSEKSLSSAYGTSSNTIYTYTSASNQSRITNGTSQLDIQPTGGGEAHNNMPPYLAVYMWQRTK